MTEFALEMCGITKVFPGVVALDEVSLRVRPGEVMALMGENGAGKSTLMKVLTGIYKADRGTIKLNGEQVSFAGPHEALKAGLAMVHQELITVPDLSVAENVFLGREMPLGPSCSPLADLAGMRRAVKQIFDEIGIEIDPRRTMRTLSVAQMQLVEIARAISMNARVIVLDEPTSAITESETELLFAQIRRLAANGVSFIYISHKMDEIFQIADAITVLRDGTLVGAYPAEQLDDDSLISLMVDRTIDELFPERECDIGEVVLEVDNLTSDRARGVSFAVRSGEVLGLAGLVGAGRSELMEAVCGLRPVSAGTVRMLGQELSVSHPADAIASGIAFVTEDRKGTGLNLIGSVSENIAMVALRKFARGGVLNRAAQRRAATAAVERLRVKTPSVSTPVLHLSGGNQQKVVLAKWLENSPKVIILDEPTRGIDIGAKQEIYRLINRLVADGIAVIMISSEMTELMGMADRIAVMCEGRLSGVLERQDFDSERILALASAFLNVGAEAPDNH
ncbi:MAG: sugar ABC transporter ATP-binding protein [Propionibacteriaceae bacterium]|nr:sugar ABC transporter ATP-binding protein [Propionibacteriaceae bacterium]